MSDNPEKGTPADPPEPAATRFESYDEIRAALEARQKKQKRPAKPGSIPVAAPAPVEPEVRRERPLLRPPMALLCILDDGSVEGEWVRLRAERTVLGRAESDVRIPHDAMISGQHAEIRRQKHGQGYQWVLVDLQSTNGTFIRVSSTVLRPGAEIIIGRGRYRFEAGVGAAATTTDSPPHETRAWAGAPLQTLVPSMVEMTPGGPGQRLALTRQEYWIGRDASACLLARPDDVLVNPRHARLYRDVKGQWFVENNKSVNGLWLRVEQIPLETACQIRLGEQRFLFRTC
jgi:pSer/pThr/pTyr-binding forkhead associated (FHA) protein